MRSEALSTKFGSGGFTLIEVLISLVVVSMGLLGVAALQMRTLQGNYDALLRSHASALASDIADRMRLNLGAVRLASGESEYQAAFGSMPPEGTDASQALRDVLEWKQSLAARLPGGDGEIDIVEATGWVTIRVRWGERSDAPEGSTAIVFVTETVI